MVYGQGKGLVGNKVAEALSPLELNLRGLPLERAEETLELIEKLTRNVVRNPREEKFRRIKLSNKKISESITSVPGAVDVLRVMGWVDAVTSAEDGPTLELPANVKPVFEVEVVKIIEAKDWYKKEQEQVKRRRTREEAKENDPDYQAMKEKLDQDRKEKAAEGPETRASVAQKMPGNGANIMRASDVGIGQSKGG
eukprot:gnl/TRDRNA2_/TRDRNA2_182058_c0_seq1.p1 gnl/TRDRNA2_/TRDRNA2_182058_c0~~gnl/TRDRNA2_/TRDRNA2_182058_c0_seq1.p1  ORF type:complete len:219 (-),score=62.98 gnl/TRDRNA2_/TRDRNA2_182058_c0_seq1:492-1079(-)